MGPKALSSRTTTVYPCSMRAPPFCAGLLIFAATLARAAMVGLEAVPADIALPLAPTALPAAEPLAGIALSPAPTALSAAVPAAALASAPSAAPAAAAAQAPAAQAAAVEEPTDEDLQAVQRALILRDPAVPPRVAKLIERELGLTADAAFFDGISRRGAQPRNSHTNEPLGEEYPTVKPNKVIVGLFHLRQNSRAYYDSLKNPATGVVATGVRGGVDTMIEDLLEKGSIQPRSAGRNLRFLNGVYMDLPHYIHEVRKYAAVDPERAQGRDRYPMVLAFRASNVHNPGADYQGRIVGDGGTLGHVALDPVTPRDVVAVYVDSSRLAQTAARLKGTALAHAQILPLDILPRH